MIVAFLSYSMRDGTLDPYALEQVADKVHGGHDFVYVDLFHNKDFRPQDHLEEVLRSSSTLFALQTPAFRFSPWVRRELSLAKRLGIKIVAVRWPANEVGATCSDELPRVALE